MSSTAATASGRWSGGTPRRVDAGSAAAYVVGVYTIVLLVHSWLRWPLLALFLLLLARAGAGWARRTPWRPADTSLLQAATHLLSLQFLIGLLLYVAFSPSIRAAFEDIGAAMRDAQLRYFLAEHTLLMAIAVTFMHIAAGRIKRAAAERRFRRTAIAVLITLLLVGAAIPWPGMSAGRPLFRIEGAAPAFF